MDESPSARHDDASMMTSRRRFLMFFLFSLASPALADERYAALKSRASQLESLGPFLERYIGSCKGEGYIRVDCEQNVRSVRRELTGRVFTASIAEQTLDIVRPERTRNGFRFLVTPFIDGGGLALTNGQPRRQDALGRPIIDFLILEGSLPSGMDEMALDRALRTGRLEMEVIFRPEGTWKMKRKGEPGFYEGVKARFLGVRITESRTGTEIASRVYGA